MEVALSAPPETSRRGTPLPLSQLVEDSRGRSSIPNHLLESKIYVKLRRNRVIQAEPAELHFRGFELQKDSVKTVKITNISSEVLNLHIIPTQTKHFETSYMKKHRLIPGLSYTLKIRFGPDEWRYYTDSVRVHCQGEENLLIPVHAYPVIDDLHIPTHVDLSAVPLGQSVCHLIPLRCSCPVDFEFQVFVLEPVEAFSISPLKGLIPANSEAEVTVTFCPVRYETCQVTIQLIVSQFNTKPYLCTVRGRCGPDADTRAHGDVVSPSSAAKMKSKDGSKWMKGTLSVKKKMKELKAEQARGEVDEDTVRQEAKETETSPEESLAQPKGPSSSFSPDPEERARARFEQAARKVVTRCGMNPHPFLVSVPVPSDEEDEESCAAEKSLGGVVPSPFGVFSDESDLLAVSDLDTLPVGTSDARVTTCVPLFSLEAPQSWKLLGYESTSVWEAFDCYLPSVLPRELRCGEEDDFGVHVETEEEGLLECDECNLDFTLPESLVCPPIGNPLRVFNPAPGLQKHQTFKYLESDLDFHLCPLMRSERAEENVLDDEFWSRAVKSLEFSPLNSASRRSGVSSERVPCSEILLPPAPPLQPAPPAGSWTPLHKVSRVDLTPEQVRAEFM